MQLNDENQKNIELKLPQSGTSESLSPRKRRKPVRYIDEMQNDNDDENEEGEDLLDEDGEELTDDQQEGKKNKKMSAQAKRILDIARIQVSTGTFP